MYEDAVGNELTLIDSNEYSYTPSLFSSGAGPAFPRGEVTIEPGQTSVGFATFDIPLGAQITKLQCVLDSGFGETLATWRVAG